MYGFFRVRYLITTALTCLGFIVAHSWIAERWPILNLYGWLQTMIRFIPIGFESGTPLGMIVSVIFIFVLMWVARVILDTITGRNGYY